MAIGEGYSYNNDSSNNGGNNENRLYENTYYSRGRFKNDSIGRALNFQFVKGLLKIDIDEVSNASGSFKFDTKISIYLSPMKCRILAEQLRVFKEYMNAGDVDENVAYGVNAGIGKKTAYIAFHTNTAKDIIVTIGTFDDNGVVLERFDYTLNNGYHYGLTWTNLDSNELEKSYYDNVEFDQIVDTVEDFARYMNGAAAYANADLTRYDYNRIMTKFNTIYDKLGIERNQGGGYNRGSNSFLNNSAASVNKTLDDFMD